MNLRYRHPETNAKLTKKQWSMLEAHEKGHAIRDYRGTWFDQYYRKGFDLQAFLATDKATNKHHNRDLALAYARGYLFTAHEIAERMAQLKNYFGMRDNEEFTQEHLEYARNNFVQDVGLDNNMTDFFSAITPETTPDFLRIINTSGI
jgi:hypothetical protein